MGVTSADKHPDLSFRARLAALPPRDHATLLLTPTLVGLGILEGVTSRSAPAGLFSAGVLLSLAAMGGYRVYMAWTKSAAPQSGRMEDTPAS